MTAEIIPMPVRAPSIEMRVAKVVVQQRRDIYERLAEAVLAIEDFATYFEAIARQTESGNMARAEIIKTLRMGADSAKAAARKIEG